MMPVLSVRTPWAHAFYLAAGPKLVENRNWKTEYRGRVAIHVPLKTDDTDPLPFEPTPQMLRDRGFVIGTVEVTDCHPEFSAGCTNAGCFEDPWAIFSVPPWPRPEHPTPKLWHWEVEHPRLFVTPIKATGKLGLWQPDPSLAHLIEIAEIL